MALIPIDRKQGRGVEQVEESILIRHDSLLDNAHEHTQVVEYCLRGCEGQAHHTGVPDQPSHFCDRHVHRSAVVTIKEWPEGLGGFIGELR